MAEAISLWRDVGRRLVHSPWLVALIIAGGACLIEGTARLEFALLFSISAETMGYILFAGAEIAIVLGACLLASLAILAVVIREGTFFGNQRPNIGPFLWHAAIAWLLLTIAQEVFGFIFGLVASLLGSSREIWLLSCAWIVAQAFARATLAGLLLRLPWRSKPKHESARVRLQLDGQRPLFASLLALFLLSASVRLGIAYGIEFESLLPSYRVSMTLILLESSLAVLLAFVAYQRISDRDPAVAAVFD